MGVDSEKAVCAESSHWIVANSLSQVAIARTAFTNVHGTCTLPVGPLSESTPAMENDGPTTTLGVSTSIDSVTAPDSPGASVSVCGATVALTPPADVVLNVHVEFCCPLFVRWIVHDCNHSACSMGSSPKSIDGVSLTTGR